MRPTRASLRCMIPQIAVPGPKKPAVVPPKVQPPSKHDRPITAYDAAGQYKGQRSPESALALIASNMAVAARNRKGYIVAIHLVGDATDGKSPILPNMPTGTRYSHMEALQCGGRVWDLNRLGGNRHGTTYAPKECRDAFFSVVQSCMSGEG